jgi:hypothetical protein
MEQAMYILISINFSLMALCLLLLNISNNLYKIVQIIIITFSFVSFWAGVYFYEIDVELSAYFMLFNYSSFIFWFLNYTSEKRNEKKIKEKEKVKRKSEMKNIFLDDIRIPDWFVEFKNKDFVVCRTYEQFVKEITSCEEVGILAFDHDLGTIETGYNAICLVEELVHFGKLKVGEIFIHTSNSSVVKKMTQAAKRCCSSVNVI